MKKRFVTLMLVLAILMAGCAAFATETEGSSKEEATQIKTGEGAAALPMEAGNEEAVSGAFTDVPEDSFFFDAVNWAVEKGITNGLTDTTFGPNEKCNRAQVVTFLWRLAGKPATSGESSFTDVPAGEWYADAVLWAVEKGITNGLDAATFGPNEKCNRAQIVTFLWRYAGMADADAENPFVDVPANEWYANAVLWAVEKDITKGLTDTTFGPNEKCNRAQIVTFLYRYAESVDEDPVDPQPTDPKPTDPQPTEPQPTEPQPTEPQPTEPEPTDPEEPTEDPNMGEWA